jgi:hypothetical protein
MPSLAFRAYRVTCRHFGGRADPVLTGTIPMTSNIAVRFISKRRGG